MYLHERAANNFLVLLLFLNAYAETRICLARSDTLCSLTPAKECLQTEASAHVICVLPFSGPTYPPLLSMGAQLQPASFIPARARVGHVIGVALQWDAGFSL
jgi:hypothetical protein